MYRVAARKKQFDQKVTQYLELETYLDRNNSISCHDALQSEIGSRQPTLEVLQPYR